MPASPLDKDDFTYEERKNKDKGCNGRKRRVILHIGLSNARSLWPKMNSLADYFTETEMSVAVVSETWFYKCEALQQLLIRAEHKDGLGMINNFRSKRKTNANPGGGISIIYKKSMLELKPVPVNVKGQEICLAEGKLRGQSRPIYIVGCYLSTRLTKTEAKKYINVLSDVVGELETKKPNAEIIVAGDFNRADLDPMLDLHPRLKLVRTPPTRKEANLDLIATTLYSNLESVSYVPPLEPDDGQAGVRSDHDFLMCSFSVATCHDFRDRSFTNRVLDEKARDKYVEIMSGVDWEEEIGQVENGIDEYVEAFHRVILGALDRAAPAIKRKRKSTDKPWVTDNFKKMADRRKRLFKTTGRTGPWKRFKSITARMSEEKKLKFYEKEAEKLSQTGSHQLPYSALSKISERDDTGQFEVESLWPDQPRRDILSKLAAYFSGISQEFEPLPVDFVGDLVDECRGNEEAAAEEWTEDQTREEFSNYDPPKTTISIDPPPRLLEDTLRLTVGPVTKIYRAVINGAEWPTLWKREEASIIPKNTAPSTMEELRSISCTSVFSKVLEKIMLGKLRGEVSLDDNQFGGQKGCGTTHLLAELNTRIMEDLEQPGSAVGVLAIDFSKAFNRMDHRACIRALYHKGASRATLEMVAGFLRDRRMMIKIGEDFSEPRTMPGGAPQGTCSGNYLFSATVDGIETEEFGRIHRQGSGADPEVGGPADDFSHVVAATTTTQGTEAEAQRQSSFGQNCARMPRGSRRAAMDTSPPGPPNLTQEQVENAMGLTPSQGAWTVKYVDDFTATQRLRVETGISHVSERKEQREIHAGELQKVFDRVRANAALIGMEVHPGKTKILCVSANYNYELSTFIFCDGKKITSTNELRVLGTVLSNRPNQWATIRHMRRKFAAKMWSLKRLRSVGIRESMLVRVYAAYLRPLLEYAIPSFYTLATVEQIEQLERCQRTALKTIYGYKHSYRKCLEQAKLQTVSERGEELV